MYSFGKLGLSAALVVALASLVAACTSASRTGPVPPVSLELQGYTKIPIPVGGGRVPLPAFNSMPEGLTFASGVAPGNFLYIRPESVSTAKPSGILRAPKGVVFLSGCPVVELSFQVAGEMDVTALAGYDFTPIAAVAPPGVEGDFSITISQGSVGPTCDSQIQLLANGDGVAKANVVTYFQLYNLTGARLEPNTLYWLTAAYQLGSPASPTPTATPSPTPTPTPSATPTATP
ncbi:MAG TPA: hypothetical protein VGN14_08435, partial [Candidatus Elarobacter sp.]